MDVPVTAGEIDWSCGDVALFLFKWENARHLFCSQRTSFRHHHGELQSSNMMSRELELPLGFLVNWEQQQIQGTFDRDLVVGHLFLEQ